MSKFSIALIAATLWLAAPFAAHAAGLGRLTVFSPLGQPLNAEIEIVSLQPGEEEGLSAQLASFEAFAQAGIEANPALTGIRFAIERRDGRPVVRITTPYAISEPFLDLLVQLEWNTGRLIREYTFLLDPPEYKGPQAIAATPPKPVASAPVAKPLPLVEAKPAPEPAAPAQALTSTAPAAETKQHEVKWGETLGGIARQNLPPGVTLEQMLIAIFRANQDAFIRENINLVRAGRILVIPSAESVGTLNIEEANRLVRGHRAEWEAYRRRLAAAPAPAEAVPGQSAVAGQIETKPEAAPPVAAQDQLRLAKVDPKTPAAAGTLAAQADDAVARERALQEAQSRVTDLEKNVTDLQKLLQMKNQQLAELERKSGTPPAAAVPTPVAASVAPSVAAPVATAPVAAAQESANPAAAPPPLAQAKIEQPAPKAKANVAKAAKAAPPPPPSFFDEFLESPYALAGLVLIILVLVVYGLWGWKRKRATQARFQESVAGAAAAGSSVFGIPEDGTAVVAGVGASSHASVNVPRAGTEAEEVDPIAEADVYMAYGRDAQAEEILREALHRDSNRLPVHAKLLEIYAKRGDAKSLEQTALKLRNLTGGTGPEWDKAAALGRSVDPHNGLYGSGSGAPVPATAAAASVAAAAPVLDFELDLGSATSSNTPSLEVPHDIRAGDTGSPANAGLDFDLGAATLPPDGTSEGTFVMDENKSSADNGLDFDLDIGGSEALRAEPATPAEQSGGLDFDLDLGTGGADTTAEPGKTAAPLDLSAISLDLGSAGEPAGSSNDPRWQEVATKLDLAKAYEEMGDKDGARELLNEVMKDGDVAQKGQAEQLFSRLG